jgi:fibro-slime domain-containing protein
MRKEKLIIFCLMALLAIPAVANAGLMGSYFNLPSTHPDMQTTITGLQTGWVESALTGATPTLTAAGNTAINQWDWWSNTYHSFDRVDSDADLQGNFTTSWFPLNEGVPGDPYYFAVHWQGQFYVDADQIYNYSMGSDDDSWLFIDKQLVLDLGGIHGITYANYNVNLTQGYHDIDIFFAERHTSQSGFQLNFFSDLEPTPTIPEPASLILLGSGILGLGILRKRNRK